MQKKQQSKKSSKNHTSHERRTIVSYLKERKSITALLTGVVLVLTVTSVLYAQGVIHLPIVGKQDDTNPSASQQERHVYLPVVVNDVGNDDTSLPTPVTEDISSWKTFIDHVAGYSLKHPHDWETWKLNEDSIVTTIVPAYDTERYRAIRVAAFQTSHPQIEASSIEELESITQRNMAEAYDLPVDMMDSLRVKLFRSDKFEGVEISHYPYVIGYHTRVEVRHGNMTYAFTLAEGGHHEGIPDYDDPLSQEDLRLMYRIIDTLEFTTQ